MNVSTWQLIQLAAMPFFLVFSVWFIKNRKDMKSKWNLLWHKNKTIKVNLITRSGRNREVYTVPDARGIMHIEKGSYVYHKETSVWNVKQALPEVTVLESQVSPPIPQLLVSYVETELPEINGEGQVSVTKEKVPKYLLSYARMKAEKLLGKTAQEIESMLASKIVQDALRATSATMARVELIFIIVCVIAGLELLSGFLMYQKLNQIGATMEALRIVAQR